MTMTPDMIRRRLEHIAEVNDHKLNDEYEDRQEIAEIMIRSIRRLARDIATAERVENGELGVGALLTIEQSS